MAATITECLDELIGLAQELGSLRARAAQADHVADMAPKGATRRPRRTARELWKQYEAKADQVSNARVRFLAVIGQIGFGQVPADVMERIAVRAK